MISSMYKSMASGLSAFGDMAYNAPSTISTKVQAAWAYCSESIANIAKAAASGITKLCHSYAKLSIAPKALVTFVVLLAACYGGHKAHQYLTTKADAKKADERTAKELQTKTEEDTLTTTNTTTTTTGSSGRTDNNNNNNTTNSNPDEQE